MHELTRYDLDFWDWAEAVSWANYIARITGRRRHVRRVNVAGTWGYWTVSPATPVELRAAS